MPDPSTVAPPLSAATPTRLYDATAFLYQGNPPIQRGVAPGTIDPKRVAVVRGQVQGPDGLPLPGVAITVAGHSELGHTRTRHDGLFDLALNGGAVMTLRYRKSGYLPVQRQLSMPWRDYIWAPDVVMTPLDASVTTIVVGQTGMQVAQGRLKNGRRATLLFPAGIQANMRMADGSSRPLTTLHVRATEFTLGASGPQAMPGGLPLASGYTYAVDLSVDEARDAAARGVQFSQAIPVYVENFLNFKVGSAVPAGYFDAEKSAWVAADDGRIVAVLAVDGAGQVALDIDGSGQAASVAELSAIGISPAERVQLAGLYVPGQSLWRVPVTHFTPWDFNQPYGFPPQAFPPDLSQLKNSDSDSLDDPQIQCHASQIECQNQVLRESEAIVGTPYGLAYSSARVPGRLDAYSLDIPVMGDTIPQDLFRVQFQVDVAGQRWVRSFSYQDGAPLVYRYTWDGRDGYGRTVQGRQKARITLKYIFLARYYRSVPGFRQSFGHFGDVTAQLQMAGAGGAGGGGSTGQSHVACPSRSYTFYDGRIRTFYCDRFPKATATRTVTESIGVWDAHGQGLGGWTLSVHHGYDPQDRVLYQGDGQRRRADRLPHYISTVAGDRVVGQTAISRPVALALSPAGDLYVSDYGHQIIRRISIKGVVDDVVSGVMAADLAFGPDGQLYFSDHISNTVQRRARDGSLHIVAGGGTLSGEQIPALQAMLSGPTGIALAGDGTLYVVDSEHRRVLKVGTDGVLTRIAGGGDGGMPGGPAIESTFWYPYDVALDSQGRIYISDRNNYSIYQINASGLMHVYAGGLNVFAGDGGPATQAGLCLPEGITFDQNDNLYIADLCDHRIRRVSQNGVITTVAGNGLAGYGGDSGPAVAASLREPAAVAIDPEGNLYIADNMNDRVRYVSPPLPGFGFRELLISSVDGKEVYVFNQTGRHLRTLHALTGATLLSFNYDSSGLLVGVLDGDGNLSTIERDLSGTPLSMTAPDGQRTSLGLDGNGYLSAITNPAGETVRYQYSSSGLMLGRQDALGGQTQVTYDANGRVLKDQNAAAASWSLLRTALPSGYQVDKRSTLGRKTRYQVFHQADGSERRVTELPDGRLQTVSIDSAGMQTMVALDGTVIQTRPGSDPRYGMQAPFAAQTTITLPSGLQSESVQEQSGRFAVTLDALLGRMTRNGRSTTTVYDVPSRTRVTTTPSGRQIKQVIDQQGRILEEGLAGLATFSYVYDDRGRLQSMIQGQNHGTQARVYQFGYDADGKLSLLRDPLGREQHLRYDPAGRLLAQIWPDGRVTRQSYDANGNQLAVTPPGQTAYHFAYTADNLASTGTAATHYIYDADRKLSSASRPDGTMLTQDHDAAGRLLTRTLPRGQLHYSYDPGTGYVSGIHAPDAVDLGYRYDGFLPVAESWSGPVSGVVRRSYNPDFRIDQLQVNGDAIDFSYDADGLLVQAGAMTLTRDMANGLPLGTVLGKVDTIDQYNIFGERVGHKASTSASTSTNTLYQTRLTRDALGRVTHKQEMIAGSTSEFAYVYDLAGRLAGVTHNGQQVEQYQYDSNGNRTGGHNGQGAISASYDGQGRLTAYQGARYQYTASGHLQTRIAAGQTTHYQYDFLGNLTHVILPAGETIDYLIDGQNRRVGKRRNGVLVQGFLYQDLLNPVAELDAAGRLITRFVYGSKTQVPDYLIKHGQSYRIISDQRGSPRLVVNSTTGAVIQRMDYDSYGRLLLDTNPGFQPFGFAGGLYDRDTGLLRFGARDYDPNTGHWTTPDPIGFAGDSNLYGYALEDPVNRVDLDGRNALIVAPIVVGVVVGLTQGIINARHGKSFVDGAALGFGYGFSATAIGMLSGATMLSTALGIGVGSVLDFLFTGGSVASILTPAAHASRLTPEACP